MQIPFNPNAYIKSLSYVGTGGEQILGNTYGTNPSPSYDVAKSLRFNPADATDMSRTFGVPNNTGVWTVSFWVKLSGTTQSEVFSAWLSGSDYAEIRFETTGALSVVSTLSATPYVGSTTRLFRNIAGWTHFLIVADTNNASAISRYTIWANNVLCAFATTPWPQVTGSRFNQSGTNHRIGSQNGGSILNGYLADFYFLDGQSLTPDSFGEYDTLYDRWVPKAYSGPSLTGNSFHLTFSDNSSVPNLGLDSSGLNNHFTPTGFSVTTDSDSLPDTPTDNYAIMNSTFKRVATSINVSNGGLTMTNTNAGASEHCFSSISFGPNDRVYIEAYLTYSSLLNPCWLGIDVGYSSADVTNQSGAVQYISNGNAYHYSVTERTYGASYASGTWISIKYDGPANTIEFFKNNVSQGTLGITPNTYFFTASTTGNGSASWSLNFGQKPWNYSLPSGFTGLSSKQLRYDTHAPWYDIALFKDTTVSNSWQMIDVYNGLDKIITTDTTSGPATAQLTDTNAVIRRFKGGFSIGNRAPLNTVGNKYLVEMFKAGNGLVSNTNGTITSQVSTNPHFGFSIVKYVGNGINSSTIGHGLGKQIEMFFILPLNPSGTLVKVAWHKALSAGDTYYTMCETSAEVVSTGDVWGNTPVRNSSVFSIGHNNHTNESGRNYMALCFASTPGVIDIGSFYGNGSTNGTYIDTGFEVGSVWIKSNSSDAWWIYDSVLGPHNPSIPRLSLDDPVNAVSSSSIDLLSNGFKMRATTYGNASAYKYTYIAFAKKVSSSIFSSVLGR